MEPVVTYAQPAPAPCQTCQPPSGNGAITESVPMAPRSGGGISESTEPPQRLGPTDVGPSGNGNTNLRRAPSTSKPRLDRTASIESSRGAITGRLVADDRITPMDRSTVTFVSLLDGKTRETARTDSLGQFSVELPKGDWAIYAPDRSGRADFHSRLTIQSGDRRSVLVVTR